MFEETGLSKRVAPNVKLLWIVFLYALWYFEIVPVDNFMLPTDKIIKDQRQINDVY